MSAGSTFARGLAAGAVSAGVTRLALAAARSGTFGSVQRWERTNHAGEPITLLEGPAAAAGLLAGLAVAPLPSSGVRVAGIVAVTGAAAAGAWDDLAEKGSSKGLRGHLGALRRGTVTTGAVKIAALVGAGVAAAASVGPTSSARTRAGRLLDLAVATGVVAGAANVVNLFDLRPGRSLKVAVLAAAPALGGPAAGLAACTLGTAAGALPDDLAARSMLGDTGANAVGAALGVAALAANGRAGRVGVLTGLTALTLASEKVSFSRVIASTPVLREVDAWGRRPR